MQHYTTVDPATEWKSGWIGWLVRLRGILTAVAVDAGVSIAVFIWVHWIIAVVTITAGIYLVLSLIAYRCIVLRRIESDEALHGFCHNLRDEIAGMIARPDKERALSLDKFNAGIVQRIASFFRHMIGDKNIDCALRLADLSGGKRSYVTRARSDGLDAQRSTQSKPIPSHMGLASALMQKGYKGVFIVRSIPEAIESGMWMPTPTDDYPDIKTLMVSPINGWESGKKVMIGILYVTSRKNPFMARHTLPMKAITDLLGFAYPMVMGTADHQEGANGN